MCRRSGITSSRDGRAPVRDDREAGDRRRDRDERRAGTHRIEEGRLVALATREDDWTHRDRARARIRARDRYAHREAAADLLVLPVVQRDGVECGRADRELRVDGTRSGGERRRPTTDEDVEAGRFDRHGRGPVVVTRGDGRDRGAAQRTSLDVDGANGDGGDPGERQRVRPEGSLDLRDRGDALATGDDRQRDVDGLRGRVLETDLNGKLEVSSDALRRDVEVRESHLRRPHVRGDRLERVRRHGEAWHRTRDREDGGSDGLRIERRAVLETVAAGKDDRATRDRAEGRL